MSQKIYNICNKSDYDFCRKKTKKPIGYGNFFSLLYDYFKDNYKCYFINEEERLHNLNGPAVKRRLTKEVYYYINGNQIYSEEDYWKHPDVIAYQYLKEHPELESFI